MASFGSRGNFPQQGLSSSIGIYIYSAKDFPLSEVHTHFQYQCSHLRPPMQFFILTYSLSINIPFYSFIYFMCMSCFSSILTTENKECTNVSIFNSHGFLSPPYLLPLSLSDTSYALMVLVTETKFVITWY